MGAKERDASGYKWDPKEVRNVRKGVSLSFRRLVLREFCTLLKLCYTSKGRVWFFLCVYAVHNPPSLSLFLLS